MKRHEADGLSWLSFELLDEAGVKNGVILKPHNMAYERASDQQEVLANFGKVKQQFGLKTLQWARQRHSDVVAFIQDEDEPPLADALMTQQESLGLLMTHADCQIALFYDPLHRAIASAHAGWRGNVKQLYSKTIQQMVERFGSRPVEILAVLSPSLGIEKAEFVHYKDEWPQAYWKYKNEKGCFDLWQIAEDELLENGLLASHVQIARQCTYSHPDDFFSYRLAVHNGHRGPVTATNATFISL